jgi:hypothetical protein
MRIQKNITLPYSFTKSFKKLSRNKINKSRFSINYENKSRLIQFYPSYKISDDEWFAQLAEDCFPTKMTSNNLKINFEYSRNRKNKKSLIKNRSRLLGLKKNIVMIYAIDKDLTHCHISLGCFIDIKYNFISKPAIITNWTDFENLKNYSFYFSRTECYNFLFNCNSSSFTSNQYMVEKTIKDIRSGLLKPVEYDHLFVKMLTSNDNHDIKKFIILNTPFDHNLDYFYMPKLDVNKINKITSSNKFNIEIKNNQNIILFSSPINLQSDDASVTKMELLLSNYKYSLRLNKDKLLVNFGKIKNLQVNNSNEKDIESKNLLNFEGTVDYGAVGSIIFKRGDFHYPIGLNLGNEKGYNIFLSFHSKDFGNFIKSYIEKSSLSEIVLEDET